MSSRAPNYVETLWFKRGRGTEGKGGGKKRKREKRKVTVMTLLIIEEVLKFTLGSPLSIFYIK